MAAEVLFATWTERPGNATGDTEKSPTTYHRVFLLEINANGLWWTLTISLRVTAISARFGGGAARIHCQYGIDSLRGSDVVMVSKNQSLGNFKKKSNNNWFCMLGMHITLPLVPCSAIFLVCDDTLNGVVWCSQTEKSFPVCHAGDFWSPFLPWCAICFPLDEIHEKVAQGIRVLVRLLVTLSDHFSRQIWSILVMPHSQDHILVTSQLSIFCFLSWKHSPIYARRP